MKSFRIATIGIMLLIIMGLYLKSMAFFSIVYKKYDKQEVEIRAVVVSDKTEKEYKDVYEIQVLEANIISKKENIEKDLKEQKPQSQKDKELNKSPKFKVLLNVKKDKKSSLELEYGDEIEFTSIYEAPSVARNEGGFDYRQYLRTKKIAGIINLKPNEIKVISKNKVFIVSKIVHDIRKELVNRVKEILTQDTANLCTGLLLGEKKDLSEDVQQAFRKSNLSHMLAISGAHVSYILLGITTCIQKLKLHKRYGKILIIIFLLFFMCLVGFTPSVTRACIMAILQLLASILYRKANTYQNLLISSFIILVFNPYSILDIGFQLSFGGTIGIVFFSKRLFKNQDKEDASNNEISADDERKKEHINKDKHTNKDKKSNIINMIKKLVQVSKEMCIVTISANLLIIPIMMYHFNTISFTFVISNLLAAPILGICIILSMIFLILLFIFKPLAIIFSFILQPILQLLILIAQFSSKLPFSQILVPTPSIFQIIIYYLILIFIFLIKRKSILFLLIFLIIFPYFINIFPANKLEISFIDVGQGDSMLITTPSHKTLLIDGGGSETGSFDVGEKTLIPYLLDKGIIQIDYMMFSHFDTDHCQRIICCYGKIKG